MNFDYCNDFVNKFEHVIAHPVKSNSSVYYTGVDLGTACVVMAVLDENYEPVAGAYQYADVVKDGMVVDYIGAIKIVKDMKQKLEVALETELTYAAAAIPPGTDRLIPHPLNRKPLPPSVGGHPILLLFHVFRHAACSFLENCALQAGKQNDILRRVPRHRGSAPPALTRPDPFWGHLPASFAMVRQKLAIW